MLEIAKYPSVNAKLKAMYAQKLKREDWEDLIKQDHLKDAIVLLKQKVPSLADIKPNANRIELEQALEQEIISDLRKIEKYLDDTGKKIMNAYLQKYQIRLWKRMINLLTKNEPVLEEEKRQIQGWTKTIFPKLEGMEQAQNKETLLEYVPYQDKAIKLILQNAETDFERENQLDQYYFIDFLRQVKGKNAELEKMISMEADMLNMEWIYRMNRWEQHEQEKVLIPVSYRLTDEMKNKLKQVQTIEQFKEILKHTIYAEIMENDLELDFKRYLYQEYRKKFRNPKWDISLVIIYFELVEMEKEALVTIIEGIRYHLSKEEMKRQVVVLEKDN
jgi:V/A-type H+-transporting ATPase subunit C